jgi:hypothetical protein
LEFAQNGNFLFAPSVLQLAVSSLPFNCDPASGKEKNVVRQGLNFLRTCWGMHSLVGLLFHKKMKAQSTFASGRDKICAQPQSPENIPQCGSPGVKFSACVLGDAFTWLDYYSTRK